MQEHTEQKLDFNIFVIHYEYAIDIHYMYNAICLSITFEDS